MYSNPLNYLKYSDVKQLSIRTVVIVNRRTLRQHHLEHVKKCQSFHHKGDGKFN